MDRAAQTRGRVAEEVEKDRQTPHYTGCVTGLDKKQGGTGKL